MVRTPKRAATFAAPAPGARAFRERRRHARLPVLQPLTGERPAHRAVLERDHRVRDPGVDERLRPDDAARAPGAVDHHQCLRIGREVAYAMHELGPGHVDAAGNAHPPVLGQRPAVEDHQLAPGRRQPRQFRGRDVRRAIRRFDELAESLAWHVDALEQHEPRVAPTCDPAIEHGDIRITVPGKDRGRPLGQPVVAVAQDDRRGAPRHQAGRVDLETAQRRITGEQDVGARKRPLLAHVEQRQLAVEIRELRAQRARRDPCAHRWMLGEAG
jgi:hypothetical protein